MMGLDYDNKEGFPEWKSRYMEPSTHLRDPNKLRLMTAYEKDKEDGFFLLVVQVLFFNEVTQMGDIGYQYYILSGYDKLQQQYRPPAISDNFLYPTYTEAMEQSEVHYLELLKAK